MTQSYSIFKQGPGADIEPGWWAVIHSEGRNYPLLADKLLGPFKTKSAALRAASREVQP